MHHCFFLLLQLVHKMRHYASIWEIKTLSGTITFVYLRSHKSLPRLLCFQRSHRGDWEDKIKFKQLMMSVRFRFLQNQSVSSLWGLQFASASISHKWEILNTVKEAEISKDATQQHLVLKGWKSLSEMEVDNTPIISWNSHSNSHVTGSGIFVLLL